MNTRRTLTRILLALAMLAGVTLGAPADAATLVIMPTDDDRGIDGMLTGNFLCCQLDSGQATVTLSPFFEERAALEFALAGLPSGATITAATLTVHVPAVPLPAAPNFADVHGYAGDGTITAADLIVSNLVASFQVNVAGPIDIALDPAFIQGLLTADADFAGFMLRNVTNPSGVFSIWTVDSLAPQYNPYITIDYTIDHQLVPEPSSLLLVATALALGARRAVRHHTRTRSVGAR